MGRILKELLRPLMFLFCRLFFRIEFIGAENVPLKGSVILAPNHVSYADPFWISIPIYRNVYYMAWDQVFKVPVLKQLLHIFGAFPVKLERFDRKAVQAARQVLQADEAVMIFPEGGRSTDGLLKPFKPGVSRLALTTGTAIVPVTINGGYDAWPPHRRLPRPRKVVITYHPPVLVEQIGDDAEAAAIRVAAQELSQKLQRIVASKLDPQYLPADQAILNSEW